MDTDINNIQFVDSDDMIKPETCKLLYQKAKKYDADIVYFNMEFLNDEESGLVREKQRNKEFEGIYTGKELFCKHQEMKTLKPEAVRHFIKKDFILEEDLFFYEKIIHEDMLFSFMAAMKARRVVDINQELYMYRQREGSISWGQKGKKSGSLFVCIVNICSYWMTNEFSEYESRCISNYVRGIYKSYLYSKGYQNKSLAIGGLKERLLKEIIDEKYFSDITFSEEDIEKIGNSSVNILYGAGKIATEVMSALELYDLQIDLIAVSNLAGNADSINGVRIKAISECIDFKDGTVILATDQCYHGEIIDLLSNYGFYNYITPQLHK